MFNIDMIFLDKRNSNQTWDWSYYRITPVGENIEICPITFPALDDSEVPVQTPLIVGLAIAYEKSKELLKNQWNIDRDRSELIGIRERK